MKKNLVTSPVQVGQNIETFNRDAKHHADTVRKILSHPNSQYWIYDHTNERFAPNKFVGYHGMTFEYYSQNASGIQRKDPKNRMTGGEARAAIEAALKPARFEVREQLHDLLRHWSRGLYGTDSLNKNERNWQFIVFQGDLVEPIEANLHSHLRSLIVCDEDDESAYPEGAEKFRWHRYHERDTQFIKELKKRRLTESGKLECEVCAFDFAAVYDSLGEGFIEAHHTIPIASLDGTVRTKAKDIALVCSNCHRMLHREKDITVAELCGRIEDKRNSISL